MAPNVHWTKGQSNGTSLRSYYVAKDINSMFCQDSLHPTRQRMRYERFRSLPSRIERPPSLRFPTVRYNLVSEGYRSAGPEFLATDEFVDLA